MVAIFSLNTTLLKRYQTTQSALLYLLTHIILPPQICHRLHRKPLYGWKEGLARNGIYNAVRVPLAVLLQAHPARQMFSCTS